MNNAGVFQIDMPEAPGGDDSHSDAEDAPYCPGDTEV